MRRHVKFTPEEKEEDCELVLEGLRQGQTHKEMAEDLGRSQSYISNIITLLIERRRITKDEIIEYSKARLLVVTLKYDVLQKLKDGKNMAQIAEELNTSFSTIARIKKMLIEDGLITSEEVNKSKRSVNKRIHLKDQVLEGLKSGKLLSEIAVELRVSTTTVGKIKNELILEGLVSEQKMLDLQNKSINDRNLRILFGLKSGLSQSQIARQEGISQSYVSELKQKFIQNGELIADTVSFQQSNSSENVEDSLLSENEKKIIDLLLKGLSLSNISKQLNIEQFDLSQIIEQLKKNKYITSSQIKESRENFRNEEEKKILSFLRSGYSQAEILKELTHLLAGTLSKRVSALVASGKITEEEINEARATRKAQKKQDSGIKKRNGKTSYSQSSSKRKKVPDLKEAVLQGFKAGKKKTDIAKELQISLSTVSNIRHLLIQEGLITAEEIKNLKKKGAKSETLKEQVLQGLKSGKYSSEIALELRTSQTTVKTIKKQLISEGLISEQEILDLQQKSAKERNQRILSKLKDGILQAEIARQEGISVSRITQLRKEFIARGELDGDADVPIESSFSENSDCSLLGEKEKQIIDLLLKGLPLSIIAKQLNIEQFDLSVIIKQLKRDKYITSSQINDARNKFREEEEKNILIFLRRGYSQSDILKELTYLASGTLSIRVRDLVEAGKITEKEIEKYQYEAPQGEKEIMEFVCSKLKLGFSIDEIIAADENGFLTVHRVREATEQVIQRGIISEGEIANAKARRKKEKKEEEDQMYDNTILTLFTEGATSKEIATTMGMSYEFIKARIAKLKKSGKISPAKQNKAKRNRRHKKYSEEYKKILDMLKSGFNNEEIATKLGISIYFVSERVKELIEDGKISDKLINKFRGEYLRRREDYNQTKKLLSKQRNFDGVTTTKFVAYSIDMFKLGILPEEDFTLLRQAIDYTTITEYTINFMLRVCISFGRYEDAIKFLNSCIGGYLTEDPNLIDLARKSRLAILCCQKQQRAVEMLRNGENIDKVYKKIGLTESEVIELKKKYIDSDDAPPIGFAGFDIDV